MFRSAKIRPMLKSGRRLKDRRAPWSKKCGGGLGSSGPIEVYAYVLNPKLIVS